MSLNIDTKRILPVKASGVCPKELSRLLILSQSCNVVNPGKIFHSNSADSPLTACVLRAPPGSHRPILRRTPGRTPFHPCAVLPRPASRTHPHPATPFQCPRSRTATLRRGAAAHFPPLRWPDCTLSRLRAEEYGPAGDPVDSDPGAVFEDDPDPRSDAGRPLEP